LFSSELTSYAIVGGSTPGKGATFQM